MTRLPFLLLGLLAAALSGVILVQLDAGDEEDVLPRPALRRAAPPEAAGVAEAPRGGVEDWISTILARPLLSPDRRPAAPVAPAGRPDGAALPRLAGTLVTSSGRVAIFAGGPAPLVLQEGGQVGGFTVMRIEAGRVTLAGPEGLRVLGPRFDSNRPATPTAEPALTGPAALTRPASSPAPAPGSVQAAGTPPTVPPPIPGGAVPRPGLPAIGPSPGDGGAAEGAVPFEQNAAPSGFDILRNADRSSQNTAPGGTR